MTTQTIRASASPTQTVTAKLFAATGVADTVLFTSDTAVEQTNDKGSYLCVFGEASVIPAATYKIKLFAASGIPLSASYVTLLGTDLENAEAVDVPHLQRIEDRLGFTLAILAGACADPQTAGETYAITINGNTFTADFTGLDTIGTRTTTTLAKT